MHTHHDTPEERPSWRSNWFVKNVLAETPFVGAFFQTSNIPQALRTAGRYTAMLAGGTVGMMLDMVEGDDMNESMAVKWTKSTANMAIGMSAGHIAFNTLYSLGSSTYSFFYPKPECSLNLDPSTQPLIKSVNADDRNAELGCHK